MVDLEYLYGNQLDEKWTTENSWTKNTARLLGRKRPGKWIDYAIFYSLDKRLVEIDTNMFLGVAIYSQWYYAEGSYRDTLIENLFKDRRR